jgi:hypothetical protein
MVSADAALSLKSAAQAPECQRALTSKESKKKATFLQKLRLLLLKSNSLHRLPILAQLLLRHLRLAHTPLW